MLLQETQILTNNKIDENGVVKNVKLLGWKSKNNRTYLKEAVEQALPLYEGTPIYFDHNTKNPSYRDRAGYISEPYLEEDGLYGSAHFNIKHTLFEQLKFDIENNSKNIGFSHMCEGQTNNKNEVVKVERIRSVDIVSEPATTNSFFEQEEKNNIDIKTLTERIEKLEANNLKLEEEVKELKKTKEINEQWVPVVEEKKEVNFLDRYFKTADKYKYIDLKGNK